MPASIIRHERAFGDRTEPLFSEHLKDAMRQPRADTLAREMLRHLRVQKHDPTINDPVIRNGEFISYCHLEAAGSRVVDNTATQPFNSFNHDPTAVP